MNVPFVDLREQYLSIKSEIDSAIKEVIEKTAFIGGGVVSKFEKDFAELLGVKNVISCANGTDSLEIILKAWGIGDGDEVIVPAISWISTSESVGNVGAKSVFVDINQYGLMDVDKVKYLITPRTKAIIPVHLYGNTVDVKYLMNMVKETDIKVLEDCAQSHLSYLNNNLTGTMGHVGSFSFYPGKNLGAYGDAGCIVTNDDALADYCRMIANHGQKGKHNHIIEGRNSRLDGLQAAILSAKIPYLKKWTQRRIDNAKLYGYYLKDIKDITLPLISDSGCHVYHLFVIRAKHRNELMSYLKEKGIETAIHYPLPLPFLKPYERDNNDSVYKDAYTFSQEILSLPMYPELSEKQIEYTYKMIKEFYA
jgi:dTDP-4-amino-4,6-dideoxygalactose transaminase